VSHARPLVHPRLVFPHVSFALALLLAAALGTGCSRKNTLAPTPSDASAARTADELRHRHRYDGKAVHLEGTDSGAIWALDKPADWNGDLVVYLHGYTPPTDPVALPHNEAIRDSLLGRGFAVAASSFSSNGYAVPEGVEESNELEHLFRRHIANPRRTFLFGQSLGGLIGLLMTQQEHGRDYDGTFLVCGIMGGSTEEIQYIGDIKVLFDAVYPGVFPNDLYHPPVITNPTTQIVQPALAAIQANPQGVGVIQLLARHPMAGNNPQEIVTTLLTVLGFSLQGGGDLFARTGHTSFFDNEGWRYSSPALPPALVDDINARVERHARARQAARFLREFGEPESRLRVPMLTLHTTRDPVVPVFHEDMLAQEISSPNLVQRRVDRYGHTPFNAAELMPHFQDLVNMASRPHHDDDHDDDDDLIAGPPLVLEPVGVR